MTNVLDRPQDAIRNPPPAVPISRRFRPDIEGLRAIAVLVVVLFHAGVPFLTGGYVGVDIFFVISGFLITSHLFSEVSRTGRIQFARFYGRRARRLLPLATLVVILTVLASWVLVSALQTRKVAVDAIWTALFSMNINLAYSGVDYQANQDPSPLQHYWSLAVEEQFYLLWPLILVGLVALSARLRRGTPSRAQVGLGIGLIAVVSLAYCIRETTVAQSMAYFLAPTRAWELALGGLVAVGAPWLVRQRWIQNGYLAALGLGAIAFAAVTFDDATQFPGYLAMVPTAGCAMVIAAGLARQSQLERFVLAPRPVQGLGRVSYGWYLWHWPILVLASMYIGDELTLKEGLWLGVIALWLAICSYIAFEDPLRSLPILTAKPRNSLFAGAIAIVLTLSVALTAVVLSNVRGGGEDIAAVRDVSQIPAAVELGSQTVAVPGNLNPKLDVAADDKPDLGAADGISCMVGLLNNDISSEPGGSCVAGGTEDGSTTVVVAGDSHAYQWVPALREIAEERDWRLISMTKSGCALYDVDIVNTQLQRDYTECYEWRTRVLAKIAQEAPAMIITSGAIFSERKGDFSSRWVEGVTSTVTGLVATGATVVAIEDTPYPKKDIPTCVAKNINDARLCTLSRADALSDPERRMATTAAAVAAGAVTIDPIDWFCGAATCPVIVGNTLLYNDNSHVSATYSAQIAPLLDQQLPSVN